MDDTKNFDVKVLDDSPKELPTYRNEVQDPEMEGLTLYEKKALLVNRELDSHGMGKYQWYIFFLCGFGYLIDLLYAQAFGLVEPAIQQEFGFGGRKWCLRLHVCTLTTNQILSRATSSAAFRQGSRLGFVLSQILESEPTDGCEHI